MNSIRGSMGKTSAQECLKKYFGAEMDDPTGYDLVISTGRFTYDSAATAILEVLRIKEREHN